MIVDTSAIIAILRDEDDAAYYADALRQRCRGAVATSTWNAG